MVLPIYNVSCSPQTSVELGRISVSVLILGGEISNMVKNEDSGSPSWSASLFMQTTEDVARAVAAAAAAATTVRSPRPSVVFSSKDDNGNSPLHKLQHQVSRVLKGFSQPPEVKSGTYNPEVLTSQKRQWASVQLQSLDHRPLKEPSRLFESMVVVGLHPNCDIQALQKQYFGRKSEGSGKFRSAFSGQHQSRVEPNLEPQVLFVYPPEKQLPLKYKDLLSFCFPGGVEVHAIEKTSSMSELNEILLGQDHLKQSDLSFVFRLQSSEGHGKEENLKENSDGISSEDRANDMLNGTVDTSQLNPNDSLSEKVMDDVCHREYQMLKNNHLLKRDMNGSGVVPVDPAIEKLPDKRENGVTSEISEACDTHVDDFVTNKQLVERRFPNAVLPLLRYQQYESSESSTSLPLDEYDSESWRYSARRPQCENFNMFPGSPSEDRIFRSDLDEVETEEASFSGQEYSSDHSDILDWAKGNNHGSLQIICEYYRLPIPARGSTVTFHPLEHLHPLEFHRPDETVLHIAGSTIDLKSCSSSLELAEAHSALMAEEEAKSLSVWAVALLCGSLRLENGILSALVLSIIPLIRPYQWQSLLMPVLPNDMLDFLDAPVPYVVGVKNKTTEVQSKLTNAILVDANKNQCEMPNMPLKHNLPDYP
ncbi:hypothetical protein HYC85_025827 [Camellia sinensis]|uniref:cDENN domain-containing protein n=1 Tax=Camellia sinensis TaxID=4442 RepID=A0A7J7G515_CAMSI|nr:hypothetical protein HYC85_025827 [Camellia sinensis]